MLNYFEHKPAADIAQLLGASQNAVEVRLHRALRQAPAHAAGISRGMKPCKTIQPIPFALLRRAADDPATPAAAGGLAGRARRKARRRAQRRSAALTVASTAGVLLAALFLLLRPHGPPQIVRPNPPAPDPARTRVELAALDAEAAGYQRAVELLKRAQAAEDQARRSAELLAQPTAIDRIEAARQARR